MTVNQVSRLTGISVRTLHYYDEIGLLKPKEIKANGYREYDDIALSRLQQILFFKELDFTLDDIKKILDNPSFDKDKAFINHKNLLLLKKQRLEKIICLVDKLMKGEEDMGFSVFDMSQIEKAQKEYANEAKKRWGETDSFKESQNKTSNYNKEDWKRITKQTEQIYNDFANNMDKYPSHPDVQNLVSKWQKHITENFYNCTNEILAGLGQMYVDDERFTKNINRYKEGLAKFISDAIKIYCEIK